MGEIVLTKCDMLDPLDLMACYQEVQADVMDCLYLPEEKQWIYENIAKQGSKGFEVRYRRKQEKTTEKDELEEERLRRWNRQNINAEQNENDTEDHYFDANNKKVDRSDQEEKTLQILDRTRSLFELHMVSSLTGAGIQSL